MPTYNGPALHRAGCELMKILAKAACVEHAGIRKMVLVLEVDALPRLFTEEFLDRDGTEDLVGRLKADPSPLAGLTATPGKVGVNVTGGVRVHEVVERMTLGVDPVTFDVGDVVVCNEPGSWVDGKRGMVLAPDTTSPEGDRGVLLQVGAARTVLPAWKLTKSNQLIKESTDGN